MVQPTHKPIFRLCLCWHDPGRFMDSTLTGHITNKHMVAGSSPAVENFNSKLFPGMGGCPPGKGADGIKTGTANSKVIRRLGGMGRGAAHS